MFGAVTLALLAAAPESSVVVARRIGLDAARAQELAQQLASALEQQADSPLGAVLPTASANARLAKAGFPDTAVCNGAAACVASLAKVSGFERLVSLQLVKLGGDLAVDASVIDGRTGQSLAVVTRTIKAKALSTELSALAVELVSKLPAVATRAAATVPAPTDQPVKRAEPPPPPPPLEPAVTAAAAPALPTGRIVALGLGGAAVVSIGVAIALGVSAVGQSNQLSVLDPSYAMRVASVRQSALFADVSWAAAGAFAVAALATWLLTPSSAN
ncbi:MAG: hypothetical protein JNJ54_05335 [Myxococcaceae bacterium]|nr:hypothetical protein [Myxococcaceae bacterium]